jgi:hypothetical protein
MIGCCLMMRRLLEGEIGMKSTRRATFISSTEFSEDLEEGFCWWFSLSDVVEEGFGCWKLLTIHK